MASSSSQTQQLNLQLPPGPLGVAIKKISSTDNSHDGGGMCTVSSKSNPKSPLEVGDVIISLNGIPLKSVEGGVAAWVKLFVAFGTSVRNLVVQRRPPSSHNASSQPMASASPLPAPLDAPKQPAAAAGVVVGISNATHPTTTSTAASSATASATHLADDPMAVDDAAANIALAPKPAAAASPKLELKTCDTCKVTQWHGIGKSSTCGECRAKMQGIVPNVQKPTECDFSSQQSILDHFPCQTGKGKLRPMLDEIELLETTEEKARYVRDWRKMTKVKQEEFKKGIRVIRSTTHDTISKIAPELIAAAAADKKKHALKDSTKHNAKKQKVDHAKKQKVDNAKKPSKSSTTNKTKKSKNDFNHDDHYMKMMKDGFPEYGSISPCENYYISNNNDCFKNIADKIGLDDWKVLNGVEFNTKFYGALKANTLLKQGTIVKIPTLLCSKWKLSKLVDNHVEEVKTMATCSKCLKKEQPNDMDEILLCDGCDLEIHMSCAGLTKIPIGDWLCGSCLDVLDARKKSFTVDCPKDENGTRRSLEAKLPPLPKLDAVTVSLATKAQGRFREEMKTRRNAALDRLEENQRVLAEASQERIANLENEIGSMSLALGEDEENHKNAKRRIFAKHGLTGWHLTDHGKSHIKFRREDGTIGAAYREKTYNYHFTSFSETKSKDWSRYYRKVQACSQELNEAPEKAALKEAKNQLASVKEDLNQAKRDEKDRPGMDDEDRRNLLLDFAKLLSEPKLVFELQKNYQSRVGCDPLFLGVVKVEEPDVRVLNILKEPTELVLSIPVSPMITIDVDPIESGVEYYLFGTDVFICPKRNDFTPMDFSPTSTRTAQRDLMAMLRRDPRNKALQVSRPVIPSSVSLRGTSEERLCDITKCFDLSDLVRDCHYPIQNQPLAETPKRLADNGLVLRNYQKTSLQWLLDKESNPTGMGSSGELWSRMRGLNGNGQSFFYCELTGSIVKEIFDYHSDVDQKDSSKLGGDTFPSAAIIGSEMGLGKTVIALSLVVASPPSLENRVLPREHVAKIDHPAYVPPPSVVKCTSSTSKHAFLSNATLVIAPMTLCPQWQTEIQRFAPWMSFITLHNDETESVTEIASKDMVVVSTFMMSSPSGKSGALMKKLRQIHFHRIFLDESHYNNTGERVKLSLAQLSSTHRYCVTGTPVGHSLADLYGQLRFLRVPQFCRPDFWQQNVDQPYSEHNCYALNVLRSLLSRMVIRHSKEQTLNNGDALVTLPPRSVETLLLPFGSEAEKKIYEYVELRNTQRFMELRSESPATVLGKYFDLRGMLYSARLACAHSSLVNLDSLHNLNEKMERERQEKEERERRGKLGHGKYEDEKKFKKKQQSTSRADIFHEAIGKARPSAQGRMREAVLQFQEGEVELMECPVCLEATGEKDIALTPCAHKFCAECILSCLQSLSSSREPAGSCPECREKIKKSELTFLGDAEDAGKSVARPAEGSEKPQANEGNVSNVDINGFHLSTKDTFSAASGAGDRRGVYQPLNDSEKRQQRAFCHTLPPEFLTAWDNGFNAIGTKVARLLEEIKCMIQNDPTAKAVVFSQFLGTLDVAGQEMTVRGINYARVDGMMKQHHRADAIQSFTNDPNTRVLLLSMRGKLCFVLRFFVFLICSLPH
mmetsp:Transcript_32798/g.68981  ORF Transcript_32798/g.68981 Transcript_32798/m.68981 type:complete len:1630 (-) Transcript_32798:512-5401(-)